MEQLMHFSHDRLLSLVHLQPSHINESSDEEEEEKEEEKEEDANGFVVEDNHVGKCNMCKEQICSFHLCYYQCKDCDYSLHKFCAELPTTLLGHPLHQGHKLTLAGEYQLTNPDYSHGEWMCGVCNCMWGQFFNYHCSICEFNMDIICATMSQQKMDHPSHPHQLQRMLKQSVTRCSACGVKHDGTFYSCITCPWFSIHLECALMPSKLLIQQPTDGTVTHLHPLTLAYSFPIIDKKAKFYPNCRVCNDGFFIYLWLYKCDKCQYFVHIGCATSNYPGHGKTRKNFKDDDHPNLIRCPFPDESYNLCKHQILNQKEFIVKQNNSEMRKHYIHQHPLILVDTQTILDKKSIFLHNPMKKIQLLCDGCVKPITHIPFYKRSEDVLHCDFVLHEWCAMLPSKVEDHPGHPRHALVLLPNIPSKFLGVFKCKNCWLPSNGFAYGCMECEFYIDINCAFLPEEITHEAHPNHLLSRISASSSLSKKKCNACKVHLNDCPAFHCSSCDFYLDTECALFLPRMIRHKYDKHPLTLRYNPVDNHPSGYFCEICEVQFDPQTWFYHCTNLCGQSMHTACAPVILQCEQAIYDKYKRFVFRYVNVKFGRTLEIKGHPHLVAFVQGIKCHGRCNKCDKELQYEIIFKCLECEYALHYDCVAL